MMFHFDHFINSSEVSIMKVLIFPLCLASILWSDTLGKYPIPHQTFNLSIYIHTHIRTHSFLFYSMTAILCYCYLFWCLKLSQIGPVGTYYVFQAHFFGLSDMSPSCFEHFLWALFGTKRYSRLILYFPCSSPGIRHFFRVLAPFSGKCYLETTIYTLGVLTATWVLLIPDSLSG